MPKITTTDGNAALADLFAAAEAGRWLAHRKPE
jgi:hypothetical protein